eukprot:SAG31_NODE_19715_length_593_cov_1.354251_1_plen_28_part_01
MLALAGAGAIIYKVPAGVRPYVRRGGAR